VDGVTAGGIASARPVLSRHQGYLPDAHGLSYLLVAPILSDIPLPCLSRSRFLPSTAPAIRQTIQSGLPFVCSLGSSLLRHLRRHTRITRHPICHRPLYIVDPVALRYLSQNSNSALPCSTYALRGIIWFPLFCLHTPRWIITTSCTSLSPRSNPVVADA
jgi:hypothetical protein